MRTVFHLTLAALFVVLLSLKSYSQDVKFSWAKQMSGNKRSQGSAIIADSYGNVYSTGFFQGKVDFDPGPLVHNFTSKGYGDAYIQKLDASGHLKWIRQIGGIADDYASCIARDTLGNVYVGGQFSKTLYLDSANAAINLQAPSGGMFILKFDSLGKLLWYQGIPNANANAIKIDQNNNVYVCGSYDGKTNFKSGLDTCFLYQGGGFILKLNASDSFQWVKGYINYTLTINTLDIDKDGNIYSAGNYFDSISFQGNSLYKFKSHGKSDMFFLKCDSNGTLIWAHAYGGSDNDYPLSLKVDQSANLFVTGFFNDTLNFFDNGTGTTLISAGRPAISNYGDIFIAKMDSAGKVAWAKGLGGPGDDAGLDLYLNKNSDVYTIGVFSLPSSGALDFDPNNTVFNLYHGISFLQKMDSSGKFIGAKGLDFSPYALTLDDANTAYLTGNFTGKNINFNTGADSFLMSTAGFNYNIFVEKLLYAKTIFNSLSTAACVAPLQINGINYTASGVYNQTLKNKQGGDSILLLSVTIDSINKTVKISGDTLKCVDTKCTYQWIKCDSGKSIIPGATQASFNPTSTGSYAVILSKNGCTDTSNCNVVTGIKTESPQMLPALSIFPNPGKDKFKLVLNRNDVYTNFEISDLTGRVIINQKLNASYEMEFELNAPAGIYFLTCKSPFQSQTIKIIKQ